MLTIRIKIKTKEFKALLLKKGFKEAEYYKNNKFKKFKYYKQTKEDVAFIVNLEAYSKHIEIHYGYASTAFTKMTGCADTLKQSGVASDNINIRNMLVYSYGDNELLLWNEIKAFYDKYLNLSKEDILAVAKEKKKAFLNKINENLITLNLKKKNTTWIRCLEDDYYIKFEAQKSQWCDEYYFNIRVCRINDQSSECYYTRVNTNNKGIYNWQIITDDKFAELMNSIINDYLLPIINTPINELGKKREIFSGCACSRKKCNNCWIEKNCRGE